MEWVDPLGVEATGDCDPRRQRVERVGGTSPKNCRPTAGRVEVCNAKYGDNGWLGTTQAWLTNHDGHIHITQATVKFNDTYFDTGYYDADAWREIVTCHEIGHTLGLGHQDDDPTNLPLGSCMDYSDPPDANSDPDDHDFEQLNWIYAVFFNPAEDHPTTSSGDGGGGGGRGRGTLQANPGDAANWGHLIADRGRESVFEADLGFGTRVVTFVLWAI